MNEKTLELLSAYLDGQVSREQKIEIERLIHSDALVRQEYEEMKGFSDLITASRPLDVVAPENFRVKIMERLKVDSTSGNNEGGTTGGNSSVIKHKWIGYLTAGCVLTGLTGWFVYQDIQSQNKIDMASKVMIEAVDVKDSMKIELPGYKGELTDGDGFEPVLSKDIQSGEKETIDSDLKNKNTLSDGQVYLQGHGQVRDSDLADEVIQELPAVDSSDKVMNLESSINWTGNKIEKVLISKNINKQLSVESCLLLAKRYNLNPGLIISLVELNPTVNIEEKVAEIRISLNQTYQLSDEKRLDKIIETLSGQDNWKQIIKKNMNL